MQLSELLIRLLLIFFPGIIAMKIVDSLRDNQRKDLNVFFLNSFVLGMASYFARYILVEVINLTPWFQYKMFFLEFLVNTKKNIIWQEIIWTSITAIALGFTISFFINHKILYRIAYRFKLTKKYSDADVWNHVFGSENIGWIVIRDYERGHMFEGWVEAYSPTSTTNELFIREVTVYNIETGKELYNLDGLYISKPNEKVEIEFRKFVQSGDE